MAARRNLLPDWALLTGLFVGVVALGYAGYQFKYWLACHAFSAGSQAFADGARMFFGVYGWVCR